MMLNIKRKEMEHMDKYCLGCYYSSTITKLLYCLMTVIYFVRFLNEMVCVTLRKYKSLYICSYEKSFYPKHGIERSSLNAHVKRSLNVWCVIFNEISYRN